MKYIHDDADLKIRGSNKKSLIVSIIFHAS